MRTMLRFTPWAIQVAAYLSEYPWLLCGASYQRFDLLTGNGVLEVVARHLELFELTQPRQFEEMVAKTLQATGCQMRVRS